MSPSDITRDVIRKFREKIRKLPSRQKIRPAYRDKSVADLLTMKIDKGSICVKCGLGGNIPSTV